ncbi:type II toxin-antitoxin system VapC family toxin [Ekhidna sp.]|uniref:type II toxin-antitoxin system VapC family toxin n=1 Tax=Ekhidna sp. TaxID=2608089 RepID=UPI003B58D6D6
MANVYQVGDYNPRFNESFFFDTNIWIYLHCPIASHNQAAQRAYSAFYKKIISGNFGLFVNSLVLSEYANAYLRIDFTLWKNEEGRHGASYKQDFVGTDRFNETVEDVKDELRVILKSTERMTDNFNAIDLDHVFTEFGRADFNDAYYLELAQMNDWKIVTHDRDLFEDNEMDVDIITALN